jgi:hypothetical protein
MVFFVHTAVDRIRRIFCEELYFHYTSCCLSYRKIPAGWENVGVREVQLCVKNLASNSFEGFKKICW